LISSTTTNNVLLQCRNEKGVFQVTQCFNVNNPDLASHSAEALVLEARANLSSHQVRQLRKPAAAAETGYELIEFKRDGGLAFQ
jgi:hypothetical protein